MHVHSSALPQPGACVLVDDDDDDGGGEEAFAVVVLPGACAGVARKLEHPRSKHRVVFDYTVKYLNTFEYLLCAGLNRP